MSSRPSEVVVVGAGIIGCAVGYELARRGASVEIVDERPPAMGATQASAGVLAPYLDAQEESTFLNLTARSLDLYDALIERVTDDSGLAVPYHRTGTLDVVLLDEGMRKLRAKAALLASRGVAAELIHGDTVRREEPLLAADVVAGLLIPTHGFVVAAELTRALGAAARHYGAQLVEGGRVVKISRTNDELVVETTRGRLTANAVVVAAGSWAGQIEIAGLSSRVPVRPVRGQLLQVSWTGPTLRRVTWGERCYLVPWGDGTVLVGATIEEAGFDERATVAGVRDLLEAACDLVPHAWKASFLAARVGLRPGSPDDLPIVGRSGVVPNLWYATGHYRNGVLLAPLTAQLLVDAMLEDKVDPALDALSPRRFGQL
jgi:glycine oxidase